VGCQLEQVNGHWGWLKEVDPQSISLTTLKL